MFYFHPAGTGIAFLALTMILATLSIIRTQVNIGMDGVLIEWMGTRRFIPASEIQKATVGSDFPSTWISAFGAKLSLVSGEEYWIPIGKSYEEALALSQRLNELVVTQPQSIPEEKTTLSRDDRPWAQWIRALKAKGAAVQDYRNLPLDTAALWRTLEESASGATARAAAAIVLGATTEPGSRTRICDIATSTAEPKLRVALEAVTRDDDDAIEKALVELELVELEQRL